MRYESNVDAQLKNLSGGYATLYFWKGTYGIRGS